MGGQKYDHDQVIARAIEVAHQCENIADIAAILDMPRSSLRDILRQRGMDYPALVTAAAVHTDEDSRLLRAQARHWEKVAARYEKQLTNRDWLRDEVASLVSVLKPVPIAPMRSDGKMHEQVGVLLYSDAHFGLEVPPGQLGVFGEYNSDMAEARTIHTFRTFAHLCHMRPFPVNKVKVYLLGDNVENINMRPAQAKQTDAHVVKQTIRFANVGAHALRLLCEEFAEVEVEAVPGNHGRTTKKAGDNLPDETFDHLAYYMIQLALKDQANFKINIHEAWYFIDQIFSWKFLGLHGEDVLSWAGIPFYGIERAVKNYYMMLGMVTKESLRNMDPTASLAVDQVLSLLDLPDYVTIGHFHNPMIWNIMGVEVLANGTLAGVSLYGAKKLRRLSKPSQQVFWVHPEHGVSERCPVNLNGKH